MKMRSWKAETLLDIGVQEGLRAVKRGDREFASDIMHACVLQAERAEQEHRWNTPLGPARKRWWRR